MTADLEAALMEQALQIAPVGIASGKADYQGAFGTGTTLRYTPTLSGVKEDVILDAYRGQNTFAFTLNTGNLSVFEEEGRYFIAPTADAEEKILISDTWVYDAAGNFEKGTPSVVQVKTDLYRYIELFYNRKLSAELQAVLHSWLYESRGISSCKLSVSPSKRRRDFSVFRSATLHVGPKNRKKRRSIDVVSYDFRCFYAG